MKREVLFFASYCGDENSGCHAKAPCSACLGMSNVFEIDDEGAAYIRQLAPDRNVGAPASGKVTEEQVEKMDLAYSIAFNEQMNHLVGTGMSSAEAIASANRAGLRAALASIGLECE
jgi:ferredoxin